MTFDKALAGYFATEGYQPPITPASGDEKIPTRRVGYQAQRRADEARLKARTQEGQ